MPFSVGRHEHRRRPLRSSARGLARRRIGCGRPAPVPPAFREPERGGAQPRLQLANQGCGGALKNRLIFSFLFCSQSGSLLATYTLCVSLPCLHRHVMYWYDAFPPTLVSRLGGSGCFHSNLGFVGGHEWHRWGTSAVTRCCVCVELGETSTSGRGGLPEVPRPQDESWRCVLTKRSLTTLRSRTRTAAAAV